MDWLIKFCLLPIYIALWALNIALWIVDVIFIRWILKTVLWIVDVVLVAFLKLLFGPLPCEWHRRRRRYRYW